MSVVERTGLGYVWQEPNHHVQFSIDNLRSIGAFTGGWVLVENIEDRDTPSFLAQGTYRIDDPNDENKLTRELYHCSPETEQMGQYVWKEMVHLFFAAVYSKEREGVPFVRVGRMPKTFHENDLIQDLIMRGDPNIFFGAGSATKGVMATAMCVSVALGRPFAGLRTDQGVPMYLDWEDHEKRLDERVKLIAAGLGLRGNDVPEVEYLRCYQPLAQIVNKVSKKRDACRADFLVIDSLDPASGYVGGWNERAGMLFDAIRVLDMTTLIIAHSNKSSIVAKGDSKQEMSVFGSIMNTNRARSIWRVQKEQGEDSPEALVTLYHEKINGGKKRKPIQLDISWREEGTIMIDQHFPMDKLR